MRNSRVARRGIEDGTGLERLGVVAPGQFQRGLQAAIAGRPQARDPEDPGRAGLQQFPQRAVPRQEAPGHVDDVDAALAGGAQQDRQQLGVRQVAGAAAQQLFAGPLGRRPVPDVHGTRVSAHMARQWSPYIGPAWPDSVLVADNVPMRGKHIILGVSGGIAAYKSADLARRLVERGAEVQVVMTAAAHEFVTPLTFQAVTGRPVRDNLWDTAAEAAMGHIELARWADLVLIAPASAGLLARLATGQADDLLTTLCLATAAPVAVAPAMNRLMWANAATQANVATLQGRAVRVLGPAAGAQACGETGPGRMLEPLEIAAAIAPLLTATGPFSGRRVLLTAGPDARAHRSGALPQQSQLRQDGLRASRRRCRKPAPKWCWWPARLRWPTPGGVRRIDVESAEQMLAAVQREIPGSAASSSPPRPWPTTARRRSPPTQDQEDRAGTRRSSSTRTTDILATVAARARPPVRGRLRRRDRRRRAARARRRCCARTST